MREVFGCPSSDVMTSIRHALGVLGSAGDESHFFAQQLRSNAAVTASIRRCYLS